AERLQALAGPTVSFRGWRPDAEVAELYARCRALLFPAVEDFGITPLEAAAAGRPTIALERGGALETMVGLDAGEPPTAVFFRDYALQLLPILVVWGFSFWTFGLYRPNRLASHLSEWLDIAKASTLGVLVLVAIMTFAFRGYDYSRVVIALFWAQSIVLVSFS